ncbi:hypothetical protein FEM48_Zijuj04G0129700 [Ziziphus jujuba var. spinosa]|uniref:Cold and drought-regulated protein CORA-like n=1 Tax=Ziziphus jujuba var. spinosa TaxID=714518 RepID=A0A978VK10_ZIZJJ|nr:hypothetical protein FEM48_Zijuj04G0129700 [Ziziphus jujuba var. spinosa]
MGSRILIFLGLVFAVVLFISSEVSARDLAAQTSTDNKIEETNGLNESKYGESGGRYNGDRGGYNGGRGGYNGGRGGYPGHGGGGGGHPSHGGGGYPAVVVAAVATMVVVGVATMEEAVQSAVLMLVKLLMLNLKPNLTTKRVLLVILYYIYKKHA